MQVLYIGDLRLGDLPTKYIHRYQTHLASGSEDGGGFSTNLPAILLLLLYGIGLHRRRIGNVSLARTVDTPSFCFIVLLES